MKRGEGEPALYRGELRHEISRAASSEDPEASLRASGLRPYPWSAAAAARFARHSHEATKHLFVLSGSIDFDGLTLAAARASSSRPGPRTQPPSATRA